MQNEFGLDDFRINHVRIKHGWLYSQVVFVFLLWLRTKNKTLSFLLQTIIKLIFSYWLIDFYLVMKQTKCLTSRYSFDPK